VAKFFGVVVHGVGQEDWESAWGDIHPAMWKPAVVSEMGVNLWYVSRRLARLCCARGGMATPDRAWRVEVLRTRSGEVFQLHRRAIIGMHGGPGWARTGQIRRSVAKVQGLVGARLQTRSSFEP
jgi:hypothetical protein